jgi:hypothetical protein
MQIDVHPERHQRPLLVVPARCGRTAAIPKADFAEIGPFPQADFPVLISGERLFLSVLLRPSDAMDTMVTETKITCDNEQLFRLSGDYSVCRFHIINDRQGKVGREL